MTVGKLFTEIQSLFETKIKDAGVPFELNFEELAHDEVAVQEISFIQILTIFLNNALDATLDSREPHLWLSGFYQNSYFVAEVANYGERIPKEIEDKIFDPLFSTKEIGKGTGLGLSLAQKLARDLNWAISIVQDDKVRFQLKIAKGSE